MAPPPAAKNFQQHQPITTGLRIICESYPSNTCLRELLQNADDAGATEIEYVLDTNTYAHSPLLHNDLAEYHGPALLARNNSVFTDEDFISLSKVGDSRKRHDVATTGKFGQGFNSVSHNPPTISFLLCLFGRVSEQDLGLPLDRWAMGILTMLVTLPRSPSALVTRYPGAWGSCMGCGCKQRLSRDR